MTQYSCLVILLSGNIAVRSYCCPIILLSDKSFSSERRVFYFIGQQYFRNEKIAVTESCRDARSVRPLCQRLQHRDLTGTDAQIVRPYRTTWGDDGTKAGRRGGTTWGRRNRCGSVVLDVYGSFR